MATNHRRRFARQRDLSERQKAKHEFRVRDEIRRLEDVVQRRESKLEKARKQLTEARARAKA